MERDYAAATIRGNYSLFSLASRHACLLAFAARVPLRFRGFRHSLLFGGLYMRRIYTYR